MTKFKKIISVILTVCIIAVPSVTGIASANAESSADLQKKIEDTLAEEILNGKYVAGDKIFAKLEDKKIIFEKANEVAESAQ